MKRYSNIPRRRSPDGKRIYRTVRYPIVPKSINDIYVYTTAGDRFDTLAQQYYNDSSLWWVISISNDSLDQNSLTPPVGSQIRIPLEYSDTVNKFRALNR
jgi:hypothetical protein